MAFLQAAIDDSGNEPNAKVFVLAGFVTTATNWITFAQDWQAALRRPPSLDYFKFTEAMRLKGQFDKDRRGWTEALRDDRLEELAAIAKRSVHARFQASLTHAHYQRYLRDAVPASVRTLLTDTPFCLLAARAMVAATGATIATRLAGELTFYFDTQPGQDVVLNALWPRIAAHASFAPLSIPPEYQRPKIASPARFEDEKVWLPLQAADMLAGACRAELMTGVWPAQLSAIRELHDEGFDLGEDDLRRMGEEFFQMMKDFREENPNIPLFDFDIETAARTRKRFKAGAPMRRGKR